MEDFITYIVTQVFTDEGTTFANDVTTSSGPNFPVTTLGVTTVPPTTHLFTNTSSNSTVFTTELFSSTTESDGFIFDHYPQRVFIAVMLLLATVIGSVGNSLVILAVLFSQKLHSVTNTFVVSLAVADLLVSLSLPWNAVALLAKDGWPLPDFFCSLAAGVLVVCVGCSVYTLASIAITR